MSAKKKLLSFVYQYKGNDWFTRTIKELIDDCIKETKADAINDFVIAYIDDEEKYDGCRGCERMDDYCCIKCFRDRYLSKQKGEN